VRIVDSAITPDCVGAVLRETDGALCLGISMVTGPMITQGVEVAKALRAARPQLPIVAGGWHASILPEQTLRAPYIDAVVKGQGELTFLEIVERYARGERDLCGIAGSLYKKDGQVVWNPDRGYTDINALPKRPFDLVPFEPYAKKCDGTRWILYCTSHGCPWDCSYCSNASVYGRNWKPLLPETAVAEMAAADQALPARRGGHHRRQLPGAAGPRDRDRRADDPRGPEGRVLHPDAHGPDRPALGARARDARAERAAAHLLRPRVRLGEGDALREQAARPRDGLPNGRALPRGGDPTLFQPDLRPACRGGRGPARHDRGRGPHRQGQPRSRLLHEHLLALPGSPIWPQAISAGVREPQSLEDWAAFHPKVQVLPWLQGKKHARIQRIRDYIRMGYSARQMVIQEKRG
jgi:hypothetical protein